MDINRYISDKIQSEIQARGLDIKTLAAAGHITEEELRQLINGEIADPEVELIFRVSTALKMSLKDFFSGYEE